MLSAYADLTAIMAPSNTAPSTAHTKPWKVAQLRDNIRGGFRLHAQPHGKQR